MANFPIILYPKPVKEFLESVKTETTKISGLPVAPTMKSATKKAAHSPANSNAWLCLAIFLNLLLLTGSIFWISQTTPWILALLILICILTLIILGKKIRQGRFYQNSTPVFQIEQLIEYEKQVLAYQKVLVNRIKAKQERLFTINGHRKELAFSLSQQLLEPAGYSTAQQGASEQKFKEYLDRYFPGKIHQGFKIPIPGYEIPYSADFTYVNKTLNLYIDIEIDEPYYYKDKTPTHCCDDDKDKIRNAFFLQGNWIVIRFAEEQVVCYPNRCCKLLARIIAILSGDEELFNNFKNVPELTPIKHWTTKSARRMAKAGYRDKYLNF